MKFWMFLLLSFVYVGTAVSQDSIKIAFSLGDFFVDRWYKDRDYFVEYANSKGASVQLVYGYGEAEQQSKLTIKAINEGVNVVVIVPTKADACNEIVQAAHSKNVKVISYDRLIMNADVDYYISFDNIKVGELQAQYAVDKQPYGNYILLAGPIKDNNAILFLNGQKNILQPYVDKGDINIVHEKHLVEWNSMEAFMEMQLLTEYSGKLSAIIASNDLIASGAIMALDIGGADKGVIITGQDASIDGCRNIVQGSQSMTVYKPIKNLAHAAVDLALDVASKRLPDNIKATTHNGKTEVPSVLLEPVSVDKDNLRETVIKDGFINESEL